MLQGLCRRAADPAVAVVAAVELSAREGRNGAGDVVDDHAGGARRRAAARRLDLRRFFLAMDLLHQHSGRHHLHVRDVGDLPHRESPTRKLPIDTIGLGLLVVWIAALQIMLDKGKELDWFNSTQIVTLAVVAVVGFVLFVIWELTDEHPVVDLRLFARRNFTIGTLTMAIAYGVFFGNVVLLPLWLQTQMGYTATDAGFVLAPVGFLAIMLSPIVGRALPRRTRARSRRSRS